MYRDWKMLRYQEKFDSYYPFAHLLILVIWHTDSVIQRQGYTMIDIQTIMIMSTTQFYCCLTHRLHTSGLKLWVQGQTLRSCFIEMGFATILPKNVK